MLWKGGEPMEKEKEIRAIQEWLDYRTRVEHEAEILISQCRFEEAMERLATLD